MWHDEVRQMLTDQIVPFWRGLRDDTYGGYYGWVGYDLEVDRQADKGCILTARILWFFSTASVLLDDPALRDEADHAYGFLRDHCLDPVDGGVYWSVRHDGQVAVDTKYTYVQAFAVYALAAYYRASGDRAALELAHSIRLLIEDRCRADLGYGEAFDAAFQPIPNTELSENGVVADRTMNTLLHVFEGYAGLYEVDPSPQQAECLRGLLDLYANRVYNPRRRRQEVFFDAQWRPIIDIHSYGHDIEASWLVDWGTDLLGDAELSAQIGELNSTLAREVYATGYRDHSVPFEAEAGVRNETRHWWVQAEAVLGFLHEYVKHPARTEFLEAALDVWRFIRDFQSDPRPGSEWFREVTAAGVPVSGKPIVEEWKCPYHNGRMCIEILRSGVNAPS